MEINDSIDKYAKEMEEDGRITVLNLRDCQMRLPAVKHKWASRLVNHKVELSKTKLLIIRAKEVIIENKLKDNKVTMSRPSLERSAETHETVIKLRNKVRDEEFTIMYLDKVEQIFKSMTYDIKNLVEIMKLEQL
tara:strand:+ start:3978 stop:4382 length:405 start_codon:yes stop_codon:yes gene_type:complete